MATTTTETDTVFSRPWHLDDTFDPVPASDIVPAPVNAFESLPIVPVVRQQTYADTIKGKSCMIFGLKSEAYLKYNGVIGTIAGDTELSEDGVLRYHVFFQGEPLSIKFQQKNFRVLEEVEEEVEEEDEYDYVNPDEDEVEVKVEVEDDYDNPDFILAQENEYLSQHNQWLLQDNTSLWQDNGYLQEQLADSQAENACLKDEIKALKKMYAHLMVSVPPFVSKNNSISK